MHLQINKHLHTLMHTNLYANKHHAILSLARFLLPSKYHAKEVFTKTSNGEMQFGTVFATIPAMRITVN